MAGNIIPFRQSGIAGGMLRSAAVMALLALLLVTQTAAAAGYRLHVIHINDFHSRIEPVNRFDSTCSPMDDADGTCFGGVARVATKINELRDELRAAGENVIVVDAGDQFQGSLMYTTYKGAAAAEFMNAIGFDAMAIGNHEFDDGSQTLAEFIDLVDFPVISGNLILSGSSPLKDRVANHVVMDVGGEKIGIVSAVTTDTAVISSPESDVGFADEAAALRSDVAALERIGVNKIIALNHVGIKVDRRLAAEVAGLDAIVGGHSNTLLSSDSPDRHGDYPLWVENRAGGYVPVVQAGAHSKYVGHLVLTFDDDGEIVQASGDTILLDASVPPDPTIASRVAALAMPFEKIRNTVIGKSVAAIEGSGGACRLQECSMGNLVADAMLDEYRGQGYSIAIQNSGGLRASIDEGDVTLGEVLTTLPFQDTLATLRVDGRVIVDALEHGVGSVEGSAGRFPQVAGIRFAWDPRAAPGSGRIRDVQVMRNGAWTPIDLNASYGVVTNNFVRGGGDGYHMFSGVENAYDYGPDLAGVVAEYIEANSPYVPYTDGRIRRY